MLKERINELAHSLAPKYVEIRRQIHANPELSYQEINTSSLVQSLLINLGLEPFVLATTGVVALIEGKNPKSRIIALRADLDALPIIETNDIVYKSKIEGVMHACGHDAHTSVLLGAAEILQNTKELWEGTIKLIFQPGEEKNPGGASLMIENGVLKYPTPHGIIALHVHPGLEVGKFSFRKGKVMASSDELYFSIRSKGGHAASPHLTSDPIVIASHLVIALQQVISRNNNPISPSVLSICSIKGGNTTNVIPSEVKLMGTFRAMDEIWRAKAHEIIKKTAHSIVEGLGGSLEMHIDIGYPAVQNDPDLTERAIELAKAFKANDDIEETELRMGSEDFGFYTQKIPGCFFRLGVRNESKGIINNVHTPNFNIDEAAIEFGMGMMAWLGANC